MTEDPLKCVQPAIGPQPQAEAAPAAPVIPQEVRMSTARVGHKAPDFAAMAYVAGAFKKVSLSDYAGKWVLLCFYPGDFTFV